MLVRHHVNSLFISLLGYQSLSHSWQVSVGVMPYGVEVSAPWDTAADPSSAHGSPCCCEAA